jgi:hypothetical protein
MTSVRCHVLGANVTRVTDLEGASVRVICPEYEEANARCRLMKRVQTGGPLSQLVERLAEDTLDTRSTRCRLL